MLAKLSADWVRDTGLLVMRCMLGAIFIFHGGQKLFGWWGGPGLPGFAGWLQQLGIPFPAYAAVLAGVAEFFGGCLLVLGVWMRPAVVPLIATMCVRSTMFTVAPFPHRTRGWSTRWPWPYFCSAWR